MSPIIRNIFLIIFLLFFPLTFIFSIMSLLFQLFFLFFFILPGVRCVCILIYRSWQTPILVLSTERWLSSVLGCQRSFVINRAARFIKPSQHMKLNNNYFMHYFYLYLLFWMFGQDCAARNLDLRTAGHPASNLWEIPCHCIKKKALIAGTWAQSMPFSFVLFALCHYYFILYLLFQK